MVNIAPPRRDFDFPCFIAILDRGARLARHFIVIQNDLLCPGGCSSCVLSDSPEKSRGGGSGEFIGPGMGRTKLR